jgi:hypothetical protein
VERVQDLEGFEWRGFRVLRGKRVQGLRFRVCSSGSKVYIQGLGSRVYI